MIHRSDKEHIEAEISGLDLLLASLPEDDFLGRRSLESRRKKLVSDLEQLADQIEKRARVALYFAGAPVIGSQGIETDFGTTALSNFQDLLTKVWASSGQANLAPMGPIPDKSASMLHITSLVQGSFGFLLEELDERGEPLFETPLHVAADRVVGYLSDFADESPEKFEAAIEEVDPRVFKALRAFFLPMKRREATLRIVEGDIDKKFDRPAIDRAWSRLEAAEIDEEHVEHEGRLLGLIPIGRRFEFEADDRPTIIKGKVGEQFSQTYLQRITDEQFAGKRWKAKFHRVMVKQQGRPPVERFTLMELNVIEPEAGA